MSSAVRCRRELFRELGTAETSGHRVVTSCTVSPSPPQQGSDLNFLPDRGVHHADTMRLSVQPTEIVHAESLPPADAMAVCIPATDSRSARPATVGTSAAQLMTARSSHRTGRPIAEIAAELHVRERDVQQLLDDTLALLNGPLEQPAPPITSLPRTGRHHRAQGIQ
ncbi:hypothetical protein ACIA5G_39720 [Amycolatopsis sp. NPDC051758]|uniref:hypothetical protein n=1 Tax=Amycolatopsis sp. NPDC051758 TaxID=3363935 RepID=UPI0037A90D7A